MHKSYTQWNRRNLTNRVAKILKVFLKIVQLKEVWTFKNVLVLSFLKIFLVERATMTDLFLGSLITHYNWNLKFIILPCKLRTLTPVNSFTQYPHNKIWCFFVDLMLAFLNRDLILALRRVYQELRYTTFAQDLLGKNINNRHNHKHSFPSFVLNHLH